MTIYLGDLCKTKDNETHQEAPFKIYFNSKDSLDVEGERLLLGAHLINDAKFYNNKALKGRGNRQNNNCYFNGLEIRAERRILTGEELYLDYAIEEESSDEE